MAILEAGGIRRRHSFVALPIKHYQFPRSCLLSSVADITSSCLCPARILDPTVYILFFELTTSALRCVLLLLRIASEYLHPPPTSISHHLHSPQWQTQHHHQTHKNTSSSTNNSNNLLRLHPPPNNNPLQQRQQKMTPSPQA